MYQRHPCHDLMLKAVDLANNARWQTAPNPRVGALLLRDGVIVGQGWHKGPGHPHAEMEALADAAKNGIAPAGCTMLVTLEPCRHHGKTPPCTDAVAASGISRLVVGALDPNPAAGGGAELLRAKGLEVETGIAIQNCLDLIDDFITWQTSELPYTILKLASTLDGRIATRIGQSRWISSPETLKRTHVLRRRMQAIIVGGNTFYNDDPRLTWRHGDPGHHDESATDGQPLAIVVTSRLPEATLAMHLLKERPKSTIFWTTVASAASPKAESLRRAGIRVIGLSSKAGVDTREHKMRAELDVAEGLVNLRKEFNCHYVLCEGGGRLGLSLLKTGLARELRLHLAPKIFGDNEATPLFDGLTSMHIDQALKLRITDATPSGDDIMITLHQDMPPALALNHSK